MITSDTRWGPDLCEHYQVHENIAIQNNATLTIAPGTRVLMDAGKVVQVQRGSLVARGTADAPITFTSSAATPAAGDWGQISFETGAVGARYDDQGGYREGSVLEHVVIEYAGRRQQAQGSVLGAAIRAGGTSFGESGTAPLLDHVTVRASSGGGIEINGIRDPRLRNVVVQDSACFGVSLGNTTGTASIASSQIIASGLPPAGTGSTCQGSPGGGLRIANHRGVSIIADSTVRENVGGSLYAGGITIQGGRAVLTRNTITLNRGDNAGGAVISGATDLIFSANLVALNEGGGGGGLSVALPVNCTISGNRFNANTARAPASGFGTGGRGGGGVLITAAAPAAANACVMANEFSTNSEIDRSDPDTPRLVPSDLRVASNVGASSPRILAPDNWWGTSDESEARSRIIDFGDNSALAAVDPLPLAQGPTWKPGDAGIQLALGTARIESGGAPVLAASLPGLPPPPENKRATIGAMVLEGNITTPLSATVTYPPDLGEGMSETALRLSRWDGERWAHVFPCAAGCNQNLKQDTLSVPIAAPGIYVLSVAPENLFLPLVARPRTR